MYMFYVMVVTDIVVGCGLILVLFCLYHLYYHQDGSPSVFSIRNVVEENVPMDNLTLITSEDNNFEETTQVEEDEDFV